MGQTGSRVINKISSSFSFSGEPISEEDAQNPQVAEKALARFGRLPLVYSRRGSMYFDEDGELAHEFYEEVRKKGGGRKMRRVNEISKNGQRNLVPQGEVKYQHARIHVDFPIIMYQG